MVIYSWSSICIKSWTWMTTLLLFSNLRQLTLEHLFTRKLFTSKYISTFMYITKNILFVLKREKLV